MQAATAEIPELPYRLQGRDFKDKMRIILYRMSSCKVVSLAGDGVTGWPPNLASSAFRFQPIWGLFAFGHHAVSFFHLVRVLISVKQLKNAH